MSDHTGIQIHASRTYDGVFGWVVRRSDKPILALSGIGPGDRPLDVATGPGYLALAGSEDFELCHECGGLCCCLYLAHDEDGEYIGEGWLPAYVEEWLGKFEASGALVQNGEGSYVPGAHGMEPLHDPRLSHLPTAAGEAYRATLPEWVDTRKCQFCHPDTGCLLPPEYRAPICHEYHCELWPSSG